MPSKRKNLFNRLMPKPASKALSYLRMVVTGSFYRISDIRGTSSFADIQTQIQTMRALTADSQVSTALSFYATDATIPNASGQVIWASAIDTKHKHVADIINELFTRWNVNLLARDHILELATYGNLYIPTTEVYRDVVQDSQKLVSLSSNSIKNEEYDVVTSYKIMPETIVHLYERGQPIGFILNPDDSSSTITLPESAVTHFSLGGLLGDYKIQVRDRDGDDHEYDIKFAQPLMEHAVQPTQTLSLLENSLLLSSLSRVIRFIGLDCGDVEEEEARSALQELKDSIEQQLSLNTNTGDAQSFLNPQSPNNLIYVPKIDGNMPITIESLNMSDADESDSKLLNHYQDKKLSVLGVPKEAMNFSSNEGLGGAGSVLSQRSALYANALQRLETAYMEGWKEQINKYFRSKNMSGFVNQYKLHMQPIITTMSTVVSERRDAALSQAQAILDLLKSLGVTKNETYKKSISEALQEVFPEIASDIMSWVLDLDEGGGNDNGGF